MATPRVMAETVLVNYLASSGVAASVVAGCAAEDKAPPLVVCTATAWEDEAINLGAFNVDCKIEVKFTAGNKATFDALCLSVYNFMWLENEDLATQLNQSVADGGVNVLGASAPHKGDFTIQDGVWIESLYVTLAIQATA